MKCRNVYILSEDAYLKKGVKKSFSDLNIIDSLYMRGSGKKETYEDLVIIDNRVPPCEFIKWFERNFALSSTIYVVVITLIPTLSYIKGYEDMINIKWEGSFEQIRVDTESMLENDYPKCIYYHWSRFREPNDFESFLIHSSTSMRKTRIFCDELNITKKTYYHYRNKISVRYGFSSFNETIIFLQRQGYTGRSRIS